MDSKHILVAVADDHPVILLGIEAALDDIPTIRRIGSVRNSSELVALLDAQPCHVLVTDYAMPGGSYGDGLNLLSFLAERYPDIAIVVITSMDKPVLIRTLLARGIDHLLSKADDISHVAAAVQAAHVRRRYFSPTIAAIVQALSGGEPITKLSARETEVLSLYVAGNSINDIAERLGRSKQTVSTQKVSAMSKLGIASDADLFKFAVEVGLAKPSDAP
ncbi:LuxR family two component transcriptional regulator [Luteibacter rhizovicinus]|uniref:LuxR family two component transcriptional regulator n=1 Tax=Luteibacter rhizovicinus TaxID=242606 RepID=A0A4R3YTW2_9GAMM|nr:response regulator transcription factor [Luteibacter rhizovicinus]TCV96397.1 LuxR family two component transcriptional regulator [Luteibacter rhizovicinus]